MALCPASCQDITVIGNPVNCVPTIRQTTPSRVLFFNICDTLPDPITDGNIAPLFEDGTIVASSELANVVFNDPTYEEVPLSDCTVPLQVLVSRELTFEDRVAVDASTSSPYFTDFFDYDFWQDKLDKQTKLGYMIMYCNGDVKVARDTNGDLLTARITAFLNYQRPSGGSGKSTEFKQVSILFNGDPLALTNKPEFNVYDAGIEI